MSVGWVGLGMLAVAWGSAFLWTDIALGAGLSPAYVGFGRAAVAAVVLLAVARPRWRSWAGRGPRARDVALAALLCNALPFMLVTVGQQSVVSSIAGVLNATTPLWAVLIAVVRPEGHPVGRRQIAGVTLGFAGVMLLFTPWEHAASLSIGVPLILLATAGYAAAFTLMSRRLVHTAATPIELAAVQMTAAALMLLVPLPFQHAPSSPALIGLAAVGVLGVVCTAFTFAITYRMLATEGATGTALVGYLIPVVAVLLGAVVLGEPIGAMTIAGMTVVLAGVSLARSQRSKERERAGRSA